MVFKFVTRATESATCSWTDNPSKLRFHRPISHWKGFAESSYSGKITGLIIGSQGHLQRDRGSTYSSLSCSLNNKKKSFCKRTPPVRRW